MNMLEPFFSVRVFQRLQASQSEGEQVRLTTAPGKVP